MCATQSVLNAGEPLSCELQNSYKLDSILKVRNFFKITFSEFRVGNLPVTGDRLNFLSVVMAIDYAFFLSDCNLYNALMF